MGIQSESTYEHVVSSKRFEASFGTSFVLHVEEREGDGSVDADDRDAESIVSAPVGTKAPARRIEASV